MRKIYFFMCMVVSTFFLIGCASMMAESVNVNTMKGKDVDTVIADMRDKGILCGKKFIEKSVNSSEIGGSVNCGIKESTPFCPDFYGIYIAYDLKTNKVYSATEIKTTNCF